MIDYIDELELISKKFKLDESDFIIVGSGALTKIGGRKNGDIEFCLVPNALRKIPFPIRLVLLFLDHYDLSADVDLFSNRYMCIGVLDRDLNDPACWDFYGKYRLVKPEYEYAYKRVVNRLKDAVDIEKIQQDESLKNKLNWSLINDILSKKVPLRYRVYVEFRKIMWKLNAKMMWIARGVRKRLFRSFFGK